MKFKVVLGWRAEYIFDDIDVAADFAITALKAKCDSDDEDYSIRIELIPDEPEKDGEPENV